MSGVVVIQDGQIAADLRFHNATGDALPYTMVTFRTTSVHDALVFNLPAGEYYITETITPEGYVEADRIRFDVAPNATEIHVYGTPASEFTRRVLMLDLADPTASQKGPSPKTGEDATWVLPIAAVCLAISSGIAIYLIRSSRKKEDEK